MEWLYEAIKPYLTQTSIIGAIIIISVLWYKGIIRFNRKEDTDLKDKVSRLELDIQNIQKTLERYREEGRLETSAETELKVRKMLEDSRDHIIEAFNGVINAIGKRNN